MIDIRKGNQLILGENVLINSSNYNYHINMFKGAKLLLDGENGVLKIDNNTSSTLTDLISKNFSVIKK